MTEMRLRRRRQPADVDAHVAVAQRRELLDAARARVVKSHTVEGQITQLQASSSDASPCSSSASRFSTLRELALEPHDRVGRRIGHFDLRPIGDDANRLAVLRDDARRNADDRRVRRNVLHDDRASADPRVVAEHDRAEHARVHADRHVAAERRMALPVREARPAERYALVDRAAVADFGGLADDDARCRDR